MSRLRYCTVFTVHVAEPLLNLKDIRVEISSPPHFPQKRIDTPKSRVWIQYNDDYKEYTKKKTKLTVENRITV